MPAPTPSPTRRSAHTPVPLPSPSGIPMPSWLRGLVLLALILTLPACGRRTLRLDLVPAQDRLTPQTIEQDDGLFVSDKIAVLNLSGLLSTFHAGSLLSEGANKVSDLREALHAIEKDPSVKAVILRINSPGGTVTASQIIHDEVVRFKAKTNKPVVTMMMDMTASGGYYVACATDRLFAYPTTVTGSIGVIMQLFSLQGSLQAIHMKTYAIKSGPFKDAGSPLRDLTPDERAYFEDIVNRFYGQFLQVVAEGRPDLPADKLKELADGRVYTGDQAKALGLVDEVGYG